jgi:hypothetical protein
MMVHTRVIHCCRSSRRRPCGEHGEVAIGSQQWIRYVATDLAMESNMFDFAADCKGTACAVMPQYITQLKQIISSREITFQGAKSESGRPWTAFIPNMITTEPQQWICMLCHLAVACDGRIAGHRRLAGGTAAGALRSCRGSIGRLRRDRQRNHQLYTLFTSLLQADNGGVVMVNFYSNYINCAPAYNQPLANLSQVAGTTSWPIQSKRNVHDE